MENFKLNIDPNKNQPSKSIGMVLNRIILVDKFSGWIGFFILLMISLLLSMITLQYGLPVGKILIIILIGLPIAFFQVTNPKFGLLFYISVGYLLFLLSFIISIPVGTLMDGMLVLLYLGLFIRMKQKNEWYLLKSNIGILILLWVVYNIMQVVNPAAESRLAWVYTIRTMAIVSLIYFIFSFFIRTKEFLKAIFKLWIALSFIAACYAFKQEYIGFATYEQNMLNANPGMIDRYFQGGHMRKFSILTDPVTFAYNMVTASFLCIALMKGPIKRYKKVILGFLAFFFLYAMVFSGTRAAFVIVPATFVMYSILNFNKKTLIYFSIIIIGIIGIIYTPSSNNNIKRLQSAFWPKHDASYILREINQAKIKPFIYSHPFGGGLGSTGEWGEKFTPHSFLASFPPDSGYVRTTVELGWIGLFIFSALVLTVLITGIKNYYKIHDPELKSYSLAAILIIFSWNIGSFAQQAIVQYPSNFLFFLAISLVGVVYRIDQQQNFSLDGER